MKLEEIMAHFMYEIKKRRWFKNLSLLSSIMVITSSMNGR